MNPIRRKLLTTCISDNKGDFAIIQPQNNQLINLGVNFTIEIKIYNINYYNTVDLSIYDSFINTFNVSGNKVEEQFVINGDDDYTFGGQYFTDGSTETSAHTVELTFEHNNVKKSVDVVTDKDGTFDMGAADISSIEKYNMDDAIIYLTDELRTLLGTNASNSLANIRMIKRVPSERLTGHNQALAYVDELNNSNFGGYNDWRIPTANGSTTLGTTANELYAIERYNTTLGTVDSPNGEIVRSSTQSSSNEDYGILRSSSSSITPEYVRFTEPAYIRVVRP